jgi:hypothetical protein
MTETSENHKTEVVAAPSAAGARKHDTITMIVRKENQPQRRNSFAFQLSVISAVVGGILLLGLFLPPISLYENYIDTDDSYVALADSPDAPGLILTGEDAKVRIVTAPAEDFLASSGLDDAWNCPSADTLPTYLSPASTVYSLQQQGSSVKPVTLELEVPENEDLYGYDPALTRWRFIPTTDGVALVNRVPTCLLWTTPQDLPDVLGVTIPPSASVDAASLQSLDRIYLGGLHPTRDGRILGRLPAHINERRGLVPVVSNLQSTATIDVLTVESILSSPEVRSLHIMELVALANSKKHVGVAIDYQGLSNTPEMHDRFTRFVIELGQALHQDGKILVVFLSDTEAYDWQAVGQIADEVVIRSLHEPAAFEAGGPVEELLAWASTQVSRYKLYLGLETSSLAITETGEVSPIHASEVIQALANVAIVGEAETVAPGQTISLSLSIDSSSSDISGGISADNGDTLWFTGTAGLLERMNLANQFELGGIVFVDTYGENNYLDAAARYLANQPIEDMTAFDLGWAVRDGEGNILTTSSASELNYLVDEGIESVEVVAQANINGQPIELDNRSYTVLTSTPVEVAAEASPTVEPTEPVPTPTQSQPTAVAEEPSPTIAPPTATEAPPTQEAEPTEEAAQAVAQDTTETPFVFPTNTPIPSDTPVLTPTSTFAQPALPAPSGPATMELGGYVEQINEDTFNTLRTAGMNWIVIRIPYFNGASPIPERQRIEDLHELGFKVLYIVGGSASDFQSQNFSRNYASYVGALATFEADAIQIWDQPDNPLFWNPQDVDPADYVALLREAAEGIEFANPDTLIISAALDPSEDDDLYYQGMVAAGAADVIDCIGVNYTLGTVPPDAITGDTRGEDTRYYLSPTVDLAYDTFGGTRPVCLTIGYLSLEGYSPETDEFAWASATTIQDQAAWLAQAATLNRANGRVRLMNVFNVNFTFFGIDASAGYAIIRRDGTCPACTNLGGSQ